MARRNVGRLELTWANKDMRLLSHGDDSYEWVDPTDWRVSEVRLIRSVGQHGDPKTSNLLVRGDALHALTALGSLPEVAPAFIGKVKLAYLDPPFNTGEAFEHYDDAVEHSVWLTMLRDRLLQIRKLLRPDGSVWVHLDDSEAHRARSVLDEVFGASSFVGTVIWQKRSSRDNRAAFSSSHDYIHVYSPAGTGWKEVRNRLDDTGAYSNPDGDPRGPWRSIPMSAQAGHATAAQFYTVVSPTGVRHDPPPGRAWTYTDERFRELEADDRIYWPKGGDGKPRLKRWPEEAKGLVPFTIWPASEVSENSTAKSEIAALFPDGIAFDTPKPEKLLERIIHVATDAGDLVLDPFAGSGTTAAVAHKMGRRWVAIELSEKVFHTFTRRRLIKVVNGEDPGGISLSVVEEPAEELPESVTAEQVKVASKVVKALVEDDYFDILDEKAVKEFARLVAKAGTVKRATITNWSGGGGFREVEVAPSMFEEVEGTVVLADWAIGGELAEAVCAQVGYRYEPEAPFAGKRGRSRLAVLDGMLTSGVADFLLGHLEDDETLLVMAQALEPGVDESLRGRRSGSRAKKIPRDLARVGVLPSRLVRVASKASAPEVESKEVAEVAPV